MRTKNQPNFDFLLNAKIYFLLVFAFLGYECKSQVTNVTQSTSHSTIQAAIDAVTTLNGDVITVAPGTYNENVNVNKQLTIRSTGGRGVTTVNGSSGFLGTFTIAADNVTLGGPNQGFTINGYDSPSPGLEYAAVYVQAVRNNITVRGNEIIANGEAGLLTEFGQAVNNFVIDANVFSGKTFTGAEAGDCGFGGQFDNPNVPRQVVNINAGSGVTFTSNTITGIAGSTSTVASCTTWGQGNTVVTIDANNVVIRGNSFLGTTFRFGSHLRARGINTSISCNTFDNTGLGIAATHIVFNAGLTALTGGASPNTLAGVAIANSYNAEGAYFTGATQIYRSSAQVAALPQTPIPANTVLLAFVTNINTGISYCSIQSAISDLNTLNGHTLTVAPGTFSETVTVSKSLTINGANSGVNANSPADITMLNGARSVESILSATNIQVTAPNVTIDGFTFTGAGGIHTNGVVANAADGLTMINNVFDNVPSSAYNNNSGATAQSNLIFSNNRVVGSNAAGISAINAWDGINNMLMNANYFAGFERGIQLDNASDITISNNYFTNISHHGLQVASSCADVDITSNVFNNCNAMTQPDRGAIRLYSEVTGDINILNNIFTNNYNAVRLRSTGTFAHSYFNVNNNSFTTTANKAISDGTTGSTGFINGTCNWYGSTNAVTVASLIEGNVTFEQYLSDGTDNAMATPGFQPVPGSCSGCTSGILAYNTNTMVSYCSFEDAIAAAGPTHTIELQIGSVTLAANLTMLSGQTLVIKNGTTLINPINNILTNNGNFVLEPTGTFSNLGTFKGIGTFTGNFTNDGIFSPGN